MPFIVTPPGDKEDLGRWLQEQFDQFDAYLSQERLAEEYENAPRNPQEGMIVRADGVNWDPGAGGGFYGYHNGSWTKLG